MIKLFDLNKLSIRFLLCFALLLFSDKVSAETGCMYTSGYIYPVRSGSFTGNPPGGTYGNGSYENYAYNGRVFEDDVYCVVNTSVPCRIDGSVGVWGTKATFTRTQCPIDDYIPHMLFGVSGLGFLFIRKRLLVKPAVNF